MTTDQIKSGGELLPCPFCGGEAKRIFRLGRTPFIECQKCGIEQSGHTHAEAVAAWNTRTAIGMEAGTGETEGLDPKGDSPGPKGIAVNTGHSTPGDAEGLRKALAMAQEVRDLLLERIQGSPARSAAHNARVRTESLIAHLSSITPTQMEICPDCSGAGGDNNVWVCSRCNGSGGIATPSGRAQEPDGWVEHDGGPCPFAAAGKTVEIRVRAGTLSIMDANAVIWRWGSYISELAGPMPPDCDVVAYRLYAAPPAQDQTKGDEA